MGASLCLCCGGPTRSRVAVTAAHGGGVWVLLGPELLRFCAGDEVARRPLPLFKGGIWSMVEDSRTNLWICSYDFGLFQLTPGGDLLRWTDQGLDSLSIRAVFEDREKNLWIGSNGGGLTRLSPRRFLTVNHDSPVPRQLTRAVAPARQGGVWLAVYDAGLFHSNSSDPRRVCPGA